MGPRVVPCSLIGAIKNNCGSSTLLSASSASSPPDRCPAFQGRVTCRNPGNLSSSKLPTVSFEIKKKSSVSSPAFQISVCLVHNCFSLVVTTALCSSSPLKNIHLIFNFYTLASEELDKSTGFEYLTQKPTEPNWLWLLVALSRIAGWTPALTHRVHAIQSTYSLM